MQDFQYTNKNNVTSFSSPGKEGLEQGKEVINELTRTLAPTHTVLGVKISGKKAFVAFVKTEYAENENLDYGETTYFQENGNRGYYSSCGFGANLREYEKGSLDEYFDRETPMSSPELIVENDIYSILTAYGFVLDEITFREFFPDEWTDLLEED